MIPPHSACDYPSWHPPLRVRLTVCDEHPCAYFPDRAARMRAVMAERVDPEIYHRFMDAGFRRSGRVIYQPACRGCRECLPLRVLVDRFRPDKAQRRVLRRNADLVMTAGEPVATAEKFDLYQRYQSQWHDSAMGGGWEEFVEFLYESPVETIECECRTAEGRLVGVGICDRSREALSSVYFYFDPDEAKRSLGTWSILKEIDLARSLGMNYYYLGYRVNGCAKMEYKSNYRPHQVLLSTGEWRENE